VIDKDLVAAAAAIGLDPRHNDPLKRWDWCCPQQEQVARWVSQGIETHARAPNKGGKTHVGAGLAAALSRNHPRLGNISLPMPAPPVVGVVLVPSYKQAAETTNLAMLKMLGPHDYKIVRVPGRNYIEQMFVKSTRCRHGHDEQCGKCNRVYFWPFDGEIPAGLHVDWIWGDEPPKESMWRELRFRSRPNRELYAWITETPIERQFWEWLQADFDGCYGTPAGGRAEIKWGLDDNKFLAPEYKAQLRKRARGDPHERARIDGEYVSAGALCPFDIHTLEMWLDKVCFAGDRYDLQLVSEDGTEKTTFMPMQNGRFEVFGKKDPTESYVLICDTSKGVWDPEGKHNPSGMTVLGRRSWAQWMRFGVERGREKDAYVTPFELGQMARVVAEYYNNAMVVPEGNYELEQFLLGLGDYWNIYSEERIDKFGRIAPQAGWVTTERTKAKAMHALQTAVLEGDIIIPSRNAVQSLLGWTIDDRHQIMFPPGRFGHGEDGILLGIGAFLLATLPEPSEQEPQELSDMERFLQLVGVKRDDEPSDPGIVDRQL